MLYCVLVRSVRYCWSTSISHLDVRPHRHVYTTMTQQNIAYNWNTINMSTSTHALLLVMPRPSLPPRRPTLPKPSLPRPRLPTPQYRAELAATVTEYSSLKPTNLSSSGLALTVKLLMHSKSSPQSFSNSTWTHITTSHDVFLISNWLTLLAYGSSYKIFDKILHVSNLYWFTQNKL